MKLPLDFYDNIVYIDSKYLSNKYKSLDKGKNKTLLKQLKVSHGSVLRRYFVRKVDIEFIDHMMALLS